MNLLTKKKFSFRSHGAETDAFTVISFKGFEAISKPYEFKIILVSDKSDIDPLKVLQNPAVFTIHRDGGENVDFNGILTQFEETQEFDGYFFFKAVIAPKFWWLSLTHHNQVFLDSTVQEIMENALKDGGLVPGIDFEFRFQKKYAKLEYVCQYDESHFNFVCRWAEREGIYYFFEQTPNGEKIIFTDTKISHVDLLPGKDLDYVPPSGLDALHTKEVVKIFLCKHNLLPRRVYLKNYNYMKPSLAIEGIAEVDENGRGENYIYGVDFDSPEEGNRLAGIRAEALLCRKSVFNGESSVPFMVPGYTFDLKSHYKDIYNRKYLVTDVTHEGHQTGYLVSGISEVVEQREEQMMYSNTFGAIYSDEQFRAEHTTHKPKISGTINAKIDAAASGEYAEIDEYGRYKVILPFDRSGRFNGKASAWFRMMSPSAGQKQGMHFPLHKGTEVLLTFIDGNPDRPVIAGAVPNPETPSPVNSGNQTQSIIATGKSPVDHSAGAQEAFGIDDSGAWASGQTDNFIEFEDQAPEHIKIYSPHTIDVFAGGRYKRRELGPSEESGHDKYEKEDADGNGIFDPIDTNAANTDVEALKTTVNNFAPSNVYGFDEKKELDPGTQVPPSGFPELYEKAPVPPPSPEFEAFFTNSAVWHNSTNNFTNYIQQHPAANQLIIMERYASLFSVLYDSAKDAWEEYWKYWVHQNHSTARGYEAVNFKDPVVKTNTALSSPYYLIHDCIENLFAVPFIPTLVDKNALLQALQTYCSTEWTKWVDKRKKDWTKWQVHTMKGHVKVSHRDTFNTQEGNIYDFGGYWNYNLGNCYIENYIDQNAALNQSPNFDLLDTGGPNWKGWRTIYSNKEGGSNNEIKNTWKKGKWTPGNIWVEKKFGDSYDYLEGNTLSVMKGNTQEIVIGGKTIEEKYGPNVDNTGYVKRRYYRSAGGKSDEKKWTKTGFLQSSSHTYTTGAFHEIKNSISYNYGATTNLSWDFASSASLDFKVGASTSNSFYLSAKSDVTIGLGAAFSFELKGAGKIDISVTASLGLKVDFGAAMFLGVKGHLGGDHTYNTVSKKWTSDLPFTNVYKAAAIKADKEQLALAEAVLRIERRNAKIESKKSWIDNSDVTFALGNLFRM